MVEKKCENCYKSDNCDNEILRSEGIACDEWKEESEKCFICEIEFKEGDSFCEFFGGFAHWDCFNKQMEENAKKEVDKK